MGIRLIQVPYDSGHRNRRMGQGPLHFATNGVVENLAEITGSVKDVIVEYNDPFPTEIATTFGLLRAISEQVQAALTESAFPLMLAGNCNSTVGALGGYRSHRLGLIWFDGHGDFDTPETSTSGFLDGMGVAMVTGHCWSAMTQSIPGFHHLREDRVALVGVQAIGEVEYSRLRESGITVVQYQKTRNYGVAEALDQVLHAWSGKLDGVYVHVDMDVHDPNLAPVNSYQPSDGLSPEEVQQCVRTIAAKFRILGASVTAYDPDSDIADKGLAAGLGLISLIGEVVRQQSS